MTAIAAELFWTEILCELANITPVAQSLVRLTAILSVPLFWVVRKRRSLKLLYIRFVVLTES